MVLEVFCFFVDFECIFLPPKKIWKMVVDSDIVAGGLTVFLLICFRPKKGEDSMMPFSETIVGGRKNKKNFRLSLTWWLFKDSEGRESVHFSRNDWNLWSFSFRDLAMKKYPLLNRKVHLQSWSVFQPAILALPEFSPYPTHVWCQENTGVKQWEKFQVSTTSRRALKKNTTFGEDLVSGTPTPAIVQTGRQSQKWSTGGLLDTSTVMNPWY